MFKKIIAVFALVLTLSDIRGEDINCDKLGILLYEEIGCKPVKAKPDDHCPSSYDCSHLKSEGDCHYQGKTYKNKEALPDNATYGTCNAACFCNPDSNGQKFTCAAFDCPPVFHRHDAECVNTYKLDSCCSTGEICAPFKDIATCKVDGKTYKEGEKFNQKGVCKTCVCQKGFSGKFEAPFCLRPNCVVELRNSGDIKKNCAPVYEDKETPCCPDTWVCPEESDIFTPAKKGDTSAKTCKFGEKEIKSGQVLEKSIVEYSKKSYIKCDCKIPPLLTCFTERIEYLKGSN